MSNLVVLENVVKTYHLGKDIKVESLRGIDLIVKRGDMLSIMGPSGSGKTTFLNMIGGLDNPSEGQIIIDGVNITRMGEGELARVRREKIGFIFQFFNLVPLLTAFENVKLPMIFASELSNAEMNARAKDLLQLVGLEKRMRHRPFQMSGGEQQRVAIARALANEPAIILADEPTGNIDRETGRKIVQMIRDLNETLEQTFIIVTHDSAIAQPSKHVFHMIDGQIVLKPRDRMLNPPLNSLKREHRQLLLAELRLLKTSIISLEKRKQRMKTKSYLQAKMRYAEVLERLKQKIQELDNTPEKGNLR
jgi:putative ABC transport system ATP-binding protein